MHNQLQSSRSVRTGDFFLDYERRKTPAWPLVPRRADDAAQTILTPKEADLLRLLARGYSNVALADALCVSKSTVRTHLRNIYAKLGATSRTQAVDLGRRIGVLTEQAGCRRGAAFAHVVAARSGSMTSSSSSFPASEEESFARFMQRVQGTRREDGPKDDPVPLTAKEIRLLQLLAEGHSNKALAKKVFVALSTVRTHLRHIYAKLGAHNRTETVAVGRKYGFIR